MGRHPIPDWRKARVCECGDHGFAALTKGAVAFFSPERLPDVVGFRWNTHSGAGGRFYARTRLDGSRTIFMHALLTGTKGADHQDGDGLNNRDDNLRPCTHAENLRNRRAVRRQTTSPFKGVSRTTDGKWQAHICCDYARRNLGVFHCQIEAALAYDRAAIELHGEFARTNESLGLLDGAAPNHGPWIDRRRSPKSPEVKAKIRAALKGRAPSDEARAKMRDSQRKRRAAECARPNGTVEAAQ